MNATRVLPIVECQFGLDGGAMFGIVPKPLWERTNPADDKNRIAMATRCLYLEFGDRKVLVDAGMGDKWSEKETGIYALRHPEGTLKEQLTAHGVDPDGITDVLITHLHFDHVGGLTTAGTDGPRPTFPRARHWVQRENWAWANGPSVRDAGSYRKENFLPLIGPDGVDLRLTDGHCSPFAGIEFIVSRGHTPGMQLVKFEVDGVTVVHVADLIPTSGHVPVPYVMGYDVYPLTTCTEKAEFLSNVVRNDWVIALEHDPDHAYMRVEREPNGRFRVAARSNDLASLR
ncbi:MAG: glyoxylase-like metal-dependent hydrolase (beta-lactamase superfamily II) [Bradymonadia bacterium]|jgi:glyoxylase-like metal-dependent hydrolase (beta-lactamase superfamily II)